VTLVIPTKLDPEPKRFDVDCRTKGRDWLASSTGKEFVNKTRKRPQDYWSPFRNDLRKSFDGRCAYSAMWLSGGTVDHFESCNASRDSGRPEQIYEWTNYRLADSAVNSSKKDAVYLDPLVVQDGWFEVVLPSLLLFTTTSVPPAHRVLARSTALWLNSETIVEIRRAWYVEYQEGRLTVEQLERYAPLIARAVESSAPSRTGSTRRGLMRTSHASHKAKKPGATKKRKPSESE
jgi:hypothetical protein